MRHAIEQGIPELDRRRMEQRMIDLYDYTRSRVIFPLPYYSLKDIGAYIGYTWRDSMDGADSVLLFEEWLMHPRQSSLFKKLLAYNEDDLRATWALKTWLEREASSV